MWLDPLAACAPAHGMTAATLSSAHGDTPDGINVLVCPLPGGGQFSVLSSGLRAIPMHSFIPIPVSDACPLQLLEAGSRVHEFMTRVRQCFPHAAAVAAPVKSPHRGHHSHHESPVPHPEVPVAPTSHEDASAAHLRDLRLDELHIIDTAAARARVPAKLQPAFDRVYGRGFNFIAHTLSSPEPMQFHLAIRHAQPSPRSLWLPMRAYLDADAPGSDDAALYLPWGASIMSAGTARLSDWRGGGKTPAEMYDDMRHRFASGSFKVLEAPTAEWQAVRLDTGFKCLDGLFPPAATVAPTEAAAPMAMETSPVEGEVEYERRTVGIHDVVAADRAKRARMEAARVMLPALGCADVLRCKRVALGPNTDVIMSIDDGHVPTVE